MTLNTWGLRGNWAERLPVFREGFRELDADIITLQETILSGEQDQPAAMLGPRYYLAQQEDREKDGQGITTANRWPLERLMTFTLENPNCVNPDWPFRGIDHLLIRCGDSGGPSLPIRGCRRIFDQGATSASDHYGLMADFGPPLTSAEADMPGQVGRSGTGWAPG